MLYLKCGWKHSQIEYTEIDKLVNGELRKFNHEMFGELEVLYVDGTIYFPANEIAEGLSYARPHKAVADHCDEDGVLSWDPIDRLGRRQTKKYITAGNVSRLIVQAAKQSKNEEIRLQAKKYEKWVFDEILPSIHKHGVYITPDIIQELNRNPNYINDLIDALKEAQPKIDIYDKFLSAVNYQSMNDAAKTLNVGRNTLFSFLRRIGVLMNNNTPYQRFIKSKYFIVKMVPTKAGNRMIDVPTTYVSAKGMVWLEKVYKNGGLLKRNKAA